MPASSQGIECSNYWAILLLLFEMGFVYADTEPDVGTSFEYLIKCYNVIYIYSSCIDITNFESCELSYGLS